MHTTDRPASSPTVVHPGEGAPLQALNLLVTVKLRGEDARPCSVVELTAAHGYGLPLLSHHREDLVVIVLDGQVGVRVGRDAAELAAGGLAWVPHTVAWGFEARSATTRILVVTIGQGAAPGLDAALQALGVELEAPARPTPTVLAPGRVIEALAAHSIEVLGAPPAPVCITPAWGIDPAPSTPLSTKEHPCEHDTISHTYDACWRPPQAPP